MTSACGWSWMSSTRSVPLRGLKDALARLRKFGGRCVLGFQSIGQVSAVYGAGAQAIVENCGNTLILRCSGSENGGTSQYASATDRRPRTATQATPRAVATLPAACSQAADAVRYRLPSSRSSNRQYWPRRSNSLPDLTGYLKTASSPIWHVVRIER